MNCPILIHPSCILSNTTVGIYRGSSRLHHFLRTTSRISGRCPIIVSRFVARAGRVRFSNITRGNRVMRCNVSRRMRCTNIRSNSTAVAFPTRRVSFTATHRVGGVSHTVTGRLGVSNPFGVRCLTGNHSIGMVRYGLHTSHSFPFIDGMLGHGFVRATAHVVLSTPCRGPSGSTFSVSHVNIGTSRFSFTHLRGTSPILNISVDSANRMNYVNSAFRRTLLGSLVTANCGVPSGSGNVVLSDNNTGRGTSLLSTTRTLIGGNCAVCTATNATGFLGRGGIGTATMK